MSSYLLTSRRRIVTFAATVALGASAAACGSDDPVSEVPEVPEEGSANVFNDAIIASDSHDEVLLGGGTGEMLVTVRCGDEAGGTVVTVIADGLEPGVAYTGVLEPSTGVNLVIQSTTGGVTTGASQMTLDAEEYTVTFAELEGAEFTLRGCPS